MKYNKILYCVIIFIALIVFLSNIVNAVDSTSETGLSDIISSGDDFVQSGDSGSVIIEESSLKGISTSVYNILLAIGMVIAAIVASILGIQFMLGSAEEKADIKGKLVPFVIGCIVVFGAFGIWKLFITLGKEIF